MEVQIKEKFNQCMVRIPTMYYCATYHPTVIKKKEIPPTEMMGNVMSCHDGCHVDRNSCKHRLINKETISKFNLKQTFANFSTCHYFCDYKYVMTFANCNRRKAGQKF